jgi:DEAD/DEAH box helicase domain-containing protein
MVQVWVGRVLVVERVVGYTKKDFLTERVLEQRTLDLPVQVRPINSLPFHQNTNTYIF